MAGSLFSIFLRTAWIRLKFHGSFVHRSTDNCSSDQFAAFVAWNEPWPQQIPSFNRFTDFSALTRIACVNSQIHSFNEKTELINGKRAARSSSNEHQQQQTGNTERQRLIFDGLWSRWCWQSAVYRRSQLLVTVTGLSLSFISHVAHIVDVCSLSCRLSVRSSLMVNFFPSLLHTATGPVDVETKEIFYIIIGCCSPLQPPSAKQTSREEENTLLTWS